MDDRWNALPRWERIARYFEHYEYMAEFDQLLGVARTKLKDFSAHANMHDSPNPER